MPKKASIKYRSLRSNLVHLPLSLYAQLAQSQTRPQGIILHLSPIISGSSSSTAKEAYIGWSGLTAASSLGLAGVGSGKDVLETLEIDPEVANSLGMPEGTIISIIHDPTKARSISVTPLSSDDWEILEQNASFLEDNLLSQLRAAKKGQEINVWVKGRTKIKIRVDATVPDTTTAVLLNADTEVYVAPKLRGPKPKAQTESTMITPSYESIKGKEKARSTSKVFKVRLVPPRVASSWGLPQQANVKTRIVLCSEDVLERARRRFGVTREEAYVKLVLEQDSPDDQDQTAADTSKEASGSGPQEVEGYLVEWAEIPDGCVVVLGESSGCWSSWGHATLQAGSAQKKGQSSKSVPVNNRLPLPPRSAGLAGVENVIHDALSYLRRSAVSDRPRPLLLTGAKGCGKTSLARLIGTRLESDRDLLTEVHYVDVARMEGEGRIGTVKKKMSEWVADAKKKSPCLFILDGLDTLLPPENELAPTSNFAAFSNHFCSLLNRTSIPQGVLVIATAISSQSLHPILNQRHVFGDILKITPPNKDIRRQILQTLVNQQMGLSSEARETSASLDFVTLGSMTEGYTAADLKDLVSSALQQAVIRSTQADEPVSFMLTDFTTAQAAFTPMGLRGVSLQKSDVQWTDIGGLKEPRRVLRETLEWPTRYAQVFANCPLRLRSGLLLYGYPGCGKTLLASAVARECGLNFISVKGPEILNKYIGASEKSVRDLFERASAAKPCVLFFDEFDSIAPKRGHDSTGVTDRVVNQLLTEMDGAQGLEGVYVLAATSRPDLIDSALLRPGRLDKSLLCDMPSKEDRLEIIQAVSTKLAFDPSIDFEMLAEETEGLSGADLQAVVYNAHLDVVQASLASVDVNDDGERREGKDKSKGKGKGKAANGNGKGKAQVIDEPEREIRKPWRQIAPIVPRIEDPTLRSRIEAVLATTQMTGSETKQTVKTQIPVIEQRHLLVSLSNTRPSVSQADRARLHRIYSVFVADREKSMPNGELGRETGTRSSLM